jgi:bacterioferritin
MPRVKGVSPELREAVESIKSFCEKRSISCTHAEDMPFTQSVLVHGNDDLISTLSGYMSAMLEDKPVNMIVVPAEDRLKPTAFLFQDRIVENQYNFPTSAAARKQSQFPKSLGQGKTFGGREFPSKVGRKKKQDEDVGFKGKTINERVDGIFSMVSHDVLGVRDGAGFQPPTDDVTQTLNSLRAGEIASCLQYELFSVTVPSLHMAGLEDLFNEHEQAERTHAKQLAQRIHEIGGSPIAELSRLASLAPYQVQDASTAEEMIAILREQEEIAIESYKKAIQEVGQSDPVTRRLLEDILGDEEEHRSDMASMLEEV